MKYFLIALTGDESEEVYGALLLGEELLPAPAPCDWRFLADMRPDVRMPAEERPMALLYMEDQGFVASCQIYTTYGERHEDPTKRRTIQIRRASLKPFEKPVPVESVEPPLRHFSSSGGLVRKLREGVLQIDEELFRAVVDRGGFRIRHPVRGRSEDSVGGAKRPPARTVPMHAHRAPDVGRSTNGPREVASGDGSLPVIPSAPASQGQRYGLRRPGQGTRERYLEIVSRYANPPRRLFGLASEQESDEAFEKRIQDLDEAERKYGAGARGEEQIGYLLEGLGLGFFVFHDLQVKGRYGRVERNVDHVVVGPGGVFAVETKNFSGTYLVATSGEVEAPPRYANADKDLADAVAQARDGAVFLESVLDLRRGSVEPLLCVCRGFVVGGGVVEGDHRRAAVRVLAPGRLLEHIRTCPRQLSDEEARYFADALKQRESGAR